MNGKWGVPIKARLVLPHEANDEGKQNLFMHVNGRFSFLNSTHHLAGSVYLGNFFPARMAHLSKRDMEANDVDSIESGARGSSIISSGCPFFLMG